VRTLELQVEQIALRALSCTAKYPSARQALRGLIDHSLKAETMAFLHINNRLEGNAVLTIAGLLAVA
jgi:hypothetical protein